MEICTPVVRGVRNREPAGCPRSARFRAVFPTRRGGPPKTARSKLPPSRLRNPQSVGFEDVFFLSRAQVLSCDVTGHLILWPVFQHVSYCLAFWKNTC